MLIAPALCVAPTGAIYLPPLAGMLSLEDLSDQFAAVLRDAVEDTEVGLLANW
jgi:hypothetical protein